MKTNLILLLFLLPLAACSSKPIYDPLYGQNNTLQEQDRMKCNQRALNAYHEAVYGLRSSGQYYSRSSSMMMLQDRNWGKTAYWNEMTRCMKQRGYAMRPKGQDEPVKPLGSEQPSVPLVGTWLSLDDDEVLCFSPNSSFAVSTPGMIINGVFGQEDNQKLILKMAQLEHPWLLDYMIRGPLLTIINPKNGTTLTLYENFDNEGCGSYKHIMALGKQAERAAGYPYSSSSQSKVLPSSVYNNLSSSPLPGATSITPNAYGPGVHSDQYGRPVELRPDFGGVPGEQLQIKENVYGPGIHSDQYGRPVRAYSR